MVRFIAVLLVLLAAACRDHMLALDWKIDLGSGSASTPLVTARYIALGTERGLTIVNHDGEIRCTFETAGYVISAPQTDGKFIFFGSTNYIVYAIDPLCHERWSVQTQDRIKGDPLVLGHHVYIGSYDGHLYKLDAVTGDEVWIFPGGRALPGSDVQFETERDVLHSDFSDMDAQGVHRGELVTGGFSYSSPVGDSETVYVGNLDHRLYAIDAKTGQLRWRFKTNGPVTSSPVLLDGAVYFGSNDGRVYSIDTQKRRVNWSTMTQHWVNSSARLAADTLYIGSNDRHVYAISRDTGYVKWRFECDGPVVSRPVLYKNTVIAAGASGDGTVYLLDREKGTVVSRFRTSDKIESDPVVVGNRLYVSSHDGYLYRLKIRSEAGGI